MLITIASLYWPARTITPDIRDWAVRAVGAGRAPGWVAKQIGVAPSTVKNWTRAAERKAKCTTKPPSPQADTRQPSATPVGTSTTSRVW